MCELEKCIAYHCGAAMCGIKASNLISCRLDKYHNAEDTICALQSRLSGSGISLKIIRRTSRSLLVLVYRAKVLGRALQQQDVASFLQQYGYEADSDCMQCIEHLATRLAQQPDFPHEIGVFLGYPLEDVVGFMNKDSSKYSGMWQVYGDVAEAKARFLQYDRCSCGIMRRIAQGHSLDRIFAVAI